MIARSAARVRFDADQVFGEFGCFPDSSAFEAATPAASLLAPRALRRLGPSTIGAPLAANGRIAAMASIVAWPCSRESNVSSPLRFREP